MTPQNVDQHTNSSVMTSKDTTNPDEDTPKELTRLIQYSVEFCCKQKIGTALMMV